VALGRRRFTRAGVFAQPPIAWQNVVPDGSVVGSSAISGSVAEVAGAANVDLPAGSVVAASVVNGALTVVVQLPAGTVAGSSTITGVVGAAGFVSGSVAGSSTISGSVAATSAPTSVPDGTVAGSSTIAGTVFATFAAEGGSDSYVVPTPFYAPQPDDDLEVVALTLLLA